MKMIGLAVTSIFLCKILAFSGDFSNIPVMFDEKIGNEIISNESTYSESELAGYIVRLTGDAKEMLEITKQLYNVETTFNYISVPAAISSFLIGIILTIKALRRIQIKRRNMQERPIILHPDETYNLRQQTYI